MATFEKPKTPAEVFTATDTMVNAYVRLALMLTRDITQKLDAFTPALPQRTWKEWWKEVYADLFTTEVPPRMHERITHREFLRDACRSLEDVYNGIPQFKKPIQTMQKNILHKQLIAESLSDILATMTQITMGCAAFIPIPKESASAFLYLFENPLHQPNTLGKKPDIVSKGASYTIMVNPHTKREEDVKIEPALIQLPIAEKSIKSIRPAKQKALEFQMTPAKDLALNEMFGTMIQYNTAMQQIVAAYAEIAQGKAR